MVSADRPRIVHVNGLPVPVTEWEDDGTPKTVLIPACMHPDWVAAMPVLHWDPKPIVYQRVGP